MATGSSLTQNHSRSQSEIQRDLHRLLTLTSFIWMTNLNHIRLIGPDKFQESVIKDPPCKGADAGLIR
ncbi:hypothetical protein TNCV_1176511 [Trichonephila clavipes]|nr:hypothetical protein TNCV_1176511 [Trichonephila clavipes]